MTIASALTKPAQTRLTRRSPAYRRVTIDNRPINVMGPEMVRQSQEVIEALEADEHVKVVVSNSAVDDNFVNHSDFLAKLAASIAHEVSQPLSGIITNASTCLRMLASDPPNVDGARETARRAMRDANRASEVLTRLRRLFTSEDTTTESVDLNEATREVISLSLSELQRNRVILTTELADDLPLVSGDRVQLQQVISNLLRNASDAMRTISDRPRQLLIRTEPDESGGVRLTVKDAGIGFDSQTAGRLFEPFYTTKNDGMGMGLSVSRSIIKSHHGRLWATPNDGPGATFAFSIPRAIEGLADADGAGLLRRLPRRTRDAVDAALRVS